MTQFVCPTGQEGRAFGRLLFPEGQRYPMGTMNQTLLGLSISLNILFHCSLRTSPLRSLAALTLVVAALNPTSVISTETRSSAQCGDCGDCGLGPGFEIRSVCDEDGGVHEEPENDVESEHVTVETDSDLKKNKCSKATRRVCWYAVRAGGGGGGIMRLVSQIALATGHFPQPGIEHKKTGTRSPTVDKVWDGKYSPIINLEV
ncbi:hypothetical protein BO70DRAFT_413939 [Aspergillus heteromorphus CBS 117.55]|uniref:Uncharacterized protein n=1 Tax=Aspergillus heteromorphus CBS 117.55 TaxID=1448321 RepID=A0A317VDD1_9EURO|nr:uncharacterized protein BO70DRAFT_413939 [Aspergillus heteromorphus CBS 117.55]PWY72286.1 hypothetical protein BO70DRAFT_413939 [Aspergillus heteromorphus CBS 117.55]